LLLAALLYFAAIRPRLLGWGASSEERRQLLPGDDLVSARWQTTRGIDISAPAEDVWPWLVQMGYGRGGWYSYDWLEHLIGAGDFAEGGSAKRLIPELQQLALGEGRCAQPGRWPHRCHLRAGESAGLALPHEPAHCRASRRR
jgi:hypothetical protein